MDCQECNLNNENNDTIVVEIFELERGTSFQANSRTEMLDFIKDFPEIMRTT